MRARNWRQYNKALVQRGSLTFLIDPKAMKTLTPKVHKNKMGIKVLGEGEWKVKVHGKGGPRKWIKLHVAIDERTQEIVSEISTDSSVDDGKAFSKVIDQVRVRPKTVIGDGAYDDREVRDLIRKKGGKALIPPPSNAVYHGIDLERDEAISIIRFLGGDKRAKSIWGKLSGYSRRALVETTFSRHKKMFGERAFSRTQERIVVENRLKCVLLNKMIRASA